MNSHNTIYTIQTDIKGTVGITQIETVINRGLYRFTLLGMQTKQASDTKDRVYASIRSSGLFNLKSDNRKIIVNISPEVSNRKDSFYDLGVALSCIYSMDKKTPAYKILAIGSLSISGKILPTKRLYAALYTAYVEHIPVVACSTEDMLSVDALTLMVLNGFGIHVIADSSLQGIVEKLKAYNLTEYKPVPYTEVEKSSNIINQNPMIRLVDMPSLLRGLYISLCGGHNMIIETCSTQASNNLFRKICAYKPKKLFGQGLYVYYSEKMFDTDTYQDTVYMENIQDIRLTDTGLHGRRGVIATYPPCGCEYQYSFFEAHIQEKRCICSKRNLVQHRRRIENTYFSVFDMKEIYNQMMQEVDDSTLMAIHMQVDMIRSVQFERFVQKHTLHAKDVYFFGKESFLNKHVILDKPEEICTPEAYELWKTSSKDERVIRIAQTIEDILSVETGQMQEKKPAVSEQALLLALSYIPKMDS